MAAPESITTSNLGNKTVPKFQDSNITMLVSPVESTTSRQDAANDNTTTVPDEKKIKTEAPHDFYDREITSADTLLSKDLSSYEPSFNSHHTVRHSKGHSWKKCMMVLKLTQCWCILLLSSNLLYF